MKISLEATAIAAVVGAADIGTEELDAHQGYNLPFKNVTDITRTGVTLVSVGLNYANVETKYTDVAFYASLPLFEKSLYRLAVSTIGKTTAVRSAAARAGPASVRAASSGLQQLINPALASNYRSITPLAGRMRDDNCCLVTTLMMAETSF